MPKGGNLNSCEFSYIENTATLVVQTLPAGEKFPFSKKMLAGRTNRR